MIPPSPVFIGGGRQLKIQYAFDLFKIKPDFSGFQADRASNFQAAYIFRPSLFLSLQLSIERPIQHRRHCAASRREQRRQFFLRLSTSPGCTFRSVLPALTKTVRTGSADTCACRVPVGGNPSRHTNPLPASCRKARQAKQPQKREILGWVNDWKGSNNCFLKFKSFPLPLKIPVLDFWGKAGMGVGSQLSLKRPIQHGRHQRGQFLLRLNLYLLQRLEP
jgi:hypothetical protein